MRPRDVSSPVFGNALSEPISPDGAWKAQVYEELQEAPLETVVVDSVRLVSTSDPARSAVMLFVPHPPSIEWTSSQTLHVYVIRSLELKVLRCEFEGVHLDVELGTDDAENRAAVYKARGQPDPDPGAASHLPGANSVTQ